MSQFSCQLGANPNGLRHDQNLRWFLPSYQGVLDVLELEGTNIAVRVEPEGNMYANDVEQRDILRRHAKSRKKIAMPTEMQLLLRNGTFLYIYSSLLINTSLAYYLKFSCRQKSNKAATTTTSSLPCTPTKQNTQPCIATSSPVTRSMAASLAKASSPPSASTRSKMTTDSPLKRV